MATNPSNLSIAELVLITEFHKERAEKRDHHDVREYWCTPNQRIYHLDQADAAEAAIWERAQRDDAAAAECARVRSRRLAIIDTPTYRDLKLNKKL